MFPIRCVKASWHRKFFAGDGLSFMLGMLASLLAAAVWLQLASWKGWPVSTTHSIIGAIIGFGVAYGGLQAVHWDQVGAIAASWVISPLLSGFISYFIFRLLLRRIFYSLSPLLSAKRLAPYLVFVVFVILTLSLVFKGLKNLNLDLSLAESLVIAFAVGLVASLISVWLVSRFVASAGGVSEKNGQQAITDPALLRGLEESDQASAAGAACSARAHAAGSQRGAGAGSQYAARIAAQI